QKKDKKDK
uniref:Tachykinin-like peptide-II n=1 Tax=Phoneutria nigriventer TaxID=6918 RepID=TLP2_PHONI|nr:RecName: Full=Tachykinin-like peptide-II; AltName: Full=P.nigriventer tachykinin peptides II; Short=PnTkP-II; AltName: Full=U29-ctenitoxin-Pn1b; Short=U29-CNTX-Pn1b [Phoneutria nigriventer]